MFERPANGERCVLVQIGLNGQTVGAQEIEEFQLLAEAAGGECLMTVIAKRERPDPKYFIGKGKAEEVKQIIIREGAQLVIFNHDLSPAQERNLEALFKCRVLNRNGLILDIFAARAQSFAGKLQVELAQLQHLATRLVRGWSHLERQKGGIGLRGPGETQLETDRRLLAHRITTIKNRLKKVHQQRQLARAKRQRETIPTIALVGYTNAGKSTLFNRLVEEKTFVADQLFATLDPCLRKLDLPQYGPAVLADTVGFIRDLPHQLIDAFHATLEETSDAQLILHVIDSADELRHKHAEEVLSVLKLIDALKVPRLEVYNKIDLLNEDKAPTIERGSDGQVKRVFVSAHSGQGIDNLLTTIVEYLSQHYLYREIVLSPQQARLRAQLYELGCVLSENMDNAGNCQLSIRISQADFARLFA